MKQIEHDDCLHWLRFMADLRPRLIFADPPFNIDHGYAGFVDRLTGKQHAQFTANWLGNAAKALAPAGTLCVHIPDAMAPIVLARRGFLQKKYGVHWVDWILWHYRFGQAGSPVKRRTCINSKEHLLVFAKSPVKQRTFHPPLSVSDRKSKYKDKRTDNTKIPGMRVAFDIWGLPEDGKYWGRVHGRSKERWVIEKGAAVDHPNQLPEVYLARIIRTFSNPGDVVLDPFGGSGTTKVVGDALGRTVYTCDISAENVASIKLRCARGPVREL